MRREKGINFRARSIVNQKFGSPEEREDVMWAVEPILLAREPVAIQ